MTLRPLSALRNWLEASLANRITAVMTIISASVIFVGALASFAVIHHLLGQRSLDGVRYFTANAHQNFEQRMRLLVEDIRQLSESSIVRNALTDDDGRALYLGPLFSEKTTADLALLAISLNDHAGNTITSFGQLPADDDELKHLKRTVTDQDQARITLRSKSTKKVIEITYPVLYPPTGTTEGSLSALVDISQVFAETFGAMPENYSSTLLLGPDQPEELLDGGQSREGIEFVFRLHIPEEYFLDTPTLGARVLASNPSIANEVFWILGAFLMLSVVLILAARKASLSAAERLLRPIHALRDVAARIADGGITEAKLLPETRKDEFGILTAGFNAMTRSVRASQDGLEMRVRLRTVELARTQRTLARTLDSIQDIVYSASTNWAHTYYVSSAFSSLSDLDPHPTASAMYRLRMNIHPDDQVELEQLHKHLLEHNEGEARYRIRRSDGSDAWLHERVRKLGDTQDENEQLFGIISDITHSVAEENYRKVSEARLLLKDRALHAATNGICILEISNNGETTLEFANPAFASLCRQSHEALARAPLAFLEHAVADGDSSAEFLAAIMRGRTAHAQLCLHFSDRTHVWIEASTAPLRDSRADSNFHTICVINDITQRRDQEEWLRVQNRAMESSQNGVVIVDMTAPSQPMLYTNPAFEQITGYSADEAIGKNCRILQGPETSPSALQTIRNSLEQIRSCRITLRNYRKDGSPFWNEISLSPVRAPKNDQVTHYVGILNDITDRRETEDKLLAAFTRLDTLFSVSPDGFVSFDEDGILTFANPAFEQMFGLQSGDVAGMTIEQLDERLKKACDPASPFERTDLSSPSPSLLHVALPAARTLKRVVRTSNSNEAVAMVYFRDVTHETEVDRLKSEFLSTAAHELRTPLASIMGFSELLLTREYKPEKSKELLHTINMQSHQLTRLLNELLDLARIEARGGKDFVMERHDLSAIVMESIKAYFVPEGRSPATLQCPSEPCWVMVDSQKTHQALTNILSNAFKYSPEGGPVEVEVSASQDQSKTSFVVRVTDHGIGMTAEQAGQAFERFFRGDKSGRIPGTGLGLSLVKEIVELQGGSIELRSQDRKGTTLTLSFPAA